MKRSVPYFYFSFRSPYSWIGARLLQERLGAAFQRLTLVPFWEPDAATLQLLRQRGGETPYMPMSRAKHLYILQDIKRLTTRLGYTMQWPVDLDAWWDLPHLAYLKAHAAGRGRAFFDAIHTARWEHAADICNGAVLQRIAVQIGMEPALLVNAPADVETRAAGADALYQAYQQGVFGVPFFTLGHEKFWGVDRVEDFVVRLDQTLEQAGASS